jgi:hypothetical protein
MLCHGVTIALVPWLLDSSKALYSRQSRPLPGSDRRGEPRRPVIRAALPPAAPTVRKSSLSAHEHSSESQVDRAARLAREASKHVTSGKK